MKLFNPNSIVKIEIISSRESEYYFYKEPYKLFGFLEMGDYFYKNDIGFRGISDDFVDENEIIKNNCFIVDNKIFTKNKIRYTLVTREVISIYFENTFDFDVAVSQITGNETIKKFIIF